MTYRAASSRLCYWRSTIDTIQLGSDIYLGIEELFSFSPNVMNEIGYPSFKDKPAPQRANQIAECHFSPRARQLFPLFQCMSSASYYVTLDYGSDIPFHCLIQTPRGFRVRAMWTITKKFHSNYFWAVFWSSPCSLLLHSAMDSLAVTGLGEREQFTRVWYLWAILGFPEDYRLSF